MSSRSPQFLYIHIIFFCVSNSSHSYKYFVSLPLPSTRPTYYDLDLCLINAKRIKYKCRSSCLLIFSNLKFINTVEQMSFFFVAENLSISEEISPICLALASIIVLTIVDH